VGLGCSRVALNSFCQSEMVVACVWGAPYPVAICAIVPSFLYISRNES
jgi:uncharacterized membrane protein YraQ (UPF0718 family)